MLDTFHLICISHTMYTYLVTNFGDLLADSKPTWSFQVRWFCGLSFLGSHEHNPRQWFWQAWAIDAFVRMSWLIKIRRPAACWYLCPSSYLRPLRCSSYSCLAAATSIVFGLVRWKSFMQTPWSQFSVSKKNIFLVLPPVSKPDIQPHFGFDLLLVRW